MNKDSKIYIAGHTGLVGSALLKELTKQGYYNILTRTHKELDLLNQHDVDGFFREEKPEFVFFAAAKMGGMMEQIQRRADFLYLNLMMQTNIIQSSYMHNVKKMLYLGSICVYPEKASLPIHEDSMLTGELQYINEPYALAKITGSKMCEFYNQQYGTNFISLMLTSIYGPNDNFNLETAHVFPAIFRKIYLGKLLKEKQYDSLLNELQVEQLEYAKEYLSKMGISEEFVILFGTGNPKREFIYIDDVVSAAIFSMYNINYKDIKKDKNVHINIGTGVEFSIKEVAFEIAKVMGYNGDILFDSSKPDGTMRKIIDCSKIHSLGWKHKIELNEGIKMMYDWYLNSRNKEVKTHIRGGV
ncbi:GDP-L-fucose synthase family protein [Campylobacter sp. RM16704]|uniref:GDP-L-fucose synthase family protein n=1 Tax=Campylobacter sp. RM16704 TaxID=1500960 RepID=UPI0005822398|nr:GDP-L-fucose synthase [Campylobacter sp. RM16704]AJC85821.1 GDP-L-fucose synthetase [Campylobacter sp. RM16704]